MTTHRHSLFITHSHRQRISAPEYLVVLAASLLAAATPFSVFADNAGLMQWSFSYHDTTVPVAIWYPVSEPATEINAGPFSLTAASNASPKKQKHPLLIVSHGTGGSSMAHHPIAEALASAGFMVAALTHPGDNYQDRSLVADERYFEERPRQLVALLDALTSDEITGPLIDSDRIGAIGHSAGGYTVAVLAGAIANRDALIAHCSSVDDDPSCNYRNPALGVTSPSDETFQPPDGGDLTKINSSLVKSIVLMAPLGTVIDANSRINQHIPTRVISAELDTILPHRYHRKRIRDIAQHGVFSEETGAGHFSFIAPVNSAWKQQLGEVANDPPGFDRHAFNTQLGTELTEWFIETLTPAAD